MYGKLKAFSACGTYVVIASEDHLEGLPRTHAYSGYRTALSYADRMDTETKAPKKAFSTVVAVPVKNLMHINLSYFDDLLRAFEGLQREKYTLNTHQDPGAIIVARQVWSANLKKIRDEKESNKQIIQAELSNLYNSDID